MRLGKKFLSILMAMTMVFALFVPAMAATETTTDIIIEGTGNKFVAWRLLDAEEVTTGEKPTYKYSVNPAYRVRLQNAVDELDGASDGEIITYISKLKGDEVQAFADAVFGQVYDLNRDGDALTTNKRFEDMPQGYYLIAEVERTGTTDTISKAMLDTKGAEELTVETKEGTVELEKKVGEEVGTDGAINLQDGADYDFGDSVPFQLMGTLPDNYSGYKTYYYEFVDHLPKGLVLDENSVEIYATKENVDDITKATEKTDITDAFVMEQIPKDGYTLFTLLCSDLKTVSGLTKDHKIFVRYTATLTTDAVTGSAGNINKAHLKFSNNPYVEGYGTSVDDIVIVFTYEYDVNKVDGAGDALKGAGFTLYKQVGEDDWVKVGNEIVGGDITRFEFRGLDQGTYKLVETTVPANYNKAEDKVFTITASYDVESSDPKFKSLHVDGVLDADNDGNVEVDVVNMTGVELPSTGGIGTTIFYAAGGILVVGAAVLLFAKKRTENEE